MSKRTFDEYSCENDHFSSCEPDFSLQAFLPHHQTMFYDSDHVHLNYYESSLKKKKFDATYPHQRPSSLSLFNTTTIDPLTNSTNIHHNNNSNTTYPSSPSPSLYNNQPYYHNQQGLFPTLNNTPLCNHSMMEDDQILNDESIPSIPSPPHLLTTQSLPSNIHDSYIYRKHLQHVEYLRATVINQEMNSRKNNVINFQVKGLSGQTISFSQVDIEASTIYDLQQIIHEQLGIPITKQRIVLKGRIIPQSNAHSMLRLCEICGVENNCIFQIVCALKGG